MKILKNISKNNLLLKITSLNAIVVTVKLIISLIVQRTLAITVGEIGITKIGQLRNLLQMMTSTSSLGIFNGVVKYVSEYRDDNEYLNDFFNTTFIFIFLGTIITSLVLIICAPSITVELFGDLEFVNLIRSLALLPIVIGVNRVFQGVINGLSEYKKNAKIDLLSYVFSVGLLLTSLYYYGLKGVLFSIIVTPVIQLVVIFYVFNVTIKKYIIVKKVNLKMPFAKHLLVFTLMSFVSAVLLNYIELDIRTMITKKININEAGYWTAMSFISKNYMAFSSALFTLYVIPKFSRIYKVNVFKKEVINIYITILPFFGLGMLLIYLLREQIVTIVYPNFSGLTPLFKWQLLGDFVRLATLVIGHQFLAKKMAKSFIIAELFSLGLFYFLSKNLVVIYESEGVVMAHFIRSVIVFGVVYYLIFDYFKKQNKYKNE